jgi:hypothetical protein
MHIIIIILIILGGSSEQGVRDIMKIENNIENIQVSIDKNLKKIVYSDTSELKRIGFVEIPFNQIGIE